MDTSLQDYRADMWKHFTAEMPELAKIPVVGTVGDKTFNAEQVVALNPDVIFIPVDLKDQYESDAKPKMDAAGIQTIYIDYHAEKLESHQNPSKPSVRLWVKKNELQKLASSIQIV